MTDSIEKDIKQDSEYKSFIEVIDKIQKGIDKEASLEEMAAPLERYLKKRNQTKDAKNNSQKQLIELLTISEISKDYFKILPPEKPVLLEYIEDDGRKTPFLHKEITAMLVAEGGLGKTRSLGLLAGCLATGVPFLDTYFITKRGTTALILGENNNDDIRRLLYPINKYLIKKIEDNIKSEKRKFTVYSENIEDYEEMMANSISPFSVHGQNACFINEKGEETTFFYSLLEEFIRKEPENGWQLIILDPASRFMGVEAEKNNAIATKFIACLERISNSLKGKPTVMLAHHANKIDAKEGSASTQMSRGSSAITDGARWVSIMKKDKGNKEGNISIVEITKTNFTKYHNSIKLNFNQDGIPEFNGWVKQAENNKKEEIVGHLK